MALWERDEALRALDDLRRAGGRIALVAGEAGIGKSSLVRAFAGAQRGPVWWGACDPLVTPRALGPLHDIGRQAGGALAAALAAQEPPARLFAALLDALEGPGARPVVVIEDLHWADAASLDLLVLLARRIAGLRTLLVVTYRDDEAAGHPLHAALAAFPRDVVGRVALPPLSRDCVAAAAVRAGREPAALFALTGGNPLLVTEALSAESGGSVRHLVLDRLGRLSPEARDLAEFVAVLHRMNGAGELADRCIAEGVLVAVDGGVAYRHELLRRCVEDALPPGRRRELHRRALRRLASEPGVDPARLAHHAGLAEDPPMLQRYARIAAESAAAQGSHREAAAHYRALLSADGSGRTYAETLEAFAFQAYLAGMIAEALAARQRAAEQRGRLDEPARVGENQRWVSRLAWWNGDAGLARAAAARAVAILRREPPGRELAMALSNRAQLHMLANESEAAISWGTRAAALAERVGDLETALHAATNVATARLQGGDPHAATELLALHERAAGAGLVDHAARALVNRATTDACIAPDTTAALAALELALRYASEHDLDAYVQYLLGVRACIRFERCEWDTALTDAAASLSYPNHGGVAVVPALYALGRIESARGEPAAEATLGRALRLALTTDELQRIGPVAIARTEHFLVNGAPSRVAEEARHALELAVSRSSMGYSMELSYRVSRAVGVVDPDIADASGGSAISGSRCGGGPFADLMGGRWREAADAWERGGRLFTRVHALSAGDAAAAGEALAVLDPLGARRTAEWVRAGLRRRGVTGVPRGPRPATAANVAGLTERQAEVLRLLADGLSNAAIAERLTLSEKTVQHHVSAVLAKLSAGTRTQAAATARRLGLV